MNFRQAKHLRGKRARGDRSHEKALRQRVEIETPVEAVCECAKVAFRIFSEVEGMVGTVEAGFQVTEDGIHPMERGKFSLGFRPPTTGV